jgi:hypothetical protein
MRTRKPERPTSGVRRQAPAPAKVACATVPGVPELSAMSGSFLLTQSLQSGQRVRLDVALPVRPGTEGPASRIPRDDSARFALYSADGGVPRVKRSTSAVVRACSTARLGRVPGRAAGRPSASIGAWGCRADTGAGVQGGASCGRATLPDFSSSIMLTPDACLWLRSFDPNNTYVTRTRLRLLFNPKLLILARRTPCESRPHWACPNTNFELLPNGREPLLKTTAVDIVVSKL